MTSKTEKPALATAPDLGERYRRALWGLGVVFADVHFPGGSEMVALDVEVFLADGEDDEDKPTSSSALN